ncbi:MAG: CaiB/BaiF CoA transferase family protein [Pigmentiphaga sp.]
MQPLHGLRIIDLTQVMAGPYCTMLLGDLGADVIKIEPPAGDQIRRSMSATEGRESAGFTQLNRNKRSLVLDLKTEAGRSVLYQLVETADVLIENGRPGVAQKLGYGYDAMRQLNPRLVYASISGFGQSGPWSERPGFDMVAQAMSGVMSVSGHPGQPPCRNTISAADLGSGLMAIYGILSAVIGRQQTGEGQYIDVSLFDTILGLSIWEASEYWDTGVAPVASGSANRMSAPYQAVRAQDGYFVLAAANQRLWVSLCEVLQRPDLLADARFTDSGSRLKHREALVAEIESVLQHHPVDWWVQRLLERGIPAGPINTYDQSLNSEHAKARGMVLEAEGQAPEPVRMLGFPIKLSGTPARLDKLPPQLGEHTGHILQELNLDPAQIDTLRAAGAFGPAPELRAGSEHA